MGDPFYSHPPAATVQVQTQSCPRCTSSAVAATAKKPDANSYWRCNACGEVWSPARRETQAPPSRWPR